MGLEINSTCSLSILKAKYKQTKDKLWLEKNYKLVQAAIRLNNQIRNDFSNEGDKLRSLATTNGFVLQGIQSAVQLKKEGYAQEAFAFAELNKGVLLMDAAKSEKAYQFGNLPDSLINQEKQLQKQFARIKASLIQNLPKEQKIDLQGK